MNISVTEACSVSEKASRVVARTLNKGNVTYFYFYKILLPWTWIHKTKFTILNIRFSGFFWLLILHIRRYPPYLEAIFPVCNLRTWYALAVRGSVDVEYIWASSMYLCKPFENYYSPDGNKSPLFLCFGNSHKYQQQPLFQSDVTNTIIVCNKPDISYTEEYTRNNTGTLLCKFIVVMWSPRFYIGTYRKSIVPQIDFTQRWRNSKLKILKLVTQLTYSFCLAPLCCIIRLNILMHFFVLLETCFRKFSSYGLRKYFIRKSYSMSHRRAIISSFYFSKPTHSRLIKSQLS
jgi:hypothetical protein